MAGFLNSRNNPCDIRFMILALSYGCTLISVVFVLLALTTNNWKEIWDGNVQKSRIEVRFGLHRICYHASSSCHNRDAFDQNNYLEVVHGFINTGGFLTVFSSLVTLIMLCFDRLGVQSGARIVVYIFSVALPIPAAVFNMIACIIYSNEVEPDTEYISTYRDIELGWTFALAASTVGLLGISAALNALACLITPTPKFVF